MALLSNVAQQAALALDNARHHAQVEEQARRDSLTGVFNHGYVLSRLHEEFAHCQNTGRPLALIMLDIDHFKLYNDHYGHVVGDEVLCLVVQAIEAHLKAADSVGRWGGEEFTIVLPGSTTEQAKRVAEQMRRTLSDLALSDSSGQQLAKPTISQGIAAYPEHASSAEELIVMADRALYQAKKAGRAQVSVAGETPPPLVEGVE
jgi:diguanylate cyclase (GGDEF)-like protein